MSEKDIEELRIRVEKGIEWLVAHDPGGAFNLWWTAKLAPNSPMPAQTPERIADWREYHKQRGRWERMSADLGRIDPTWGP